MLFEKINMSYSGNQMGEIQKWIDQGVLDGSIQTICDVRRHVEGVFGEGRVSNNDIIEGIINTGGKFTNRQESDTGDICYVDLNKLTKELTTKIGTKIDIIV